MSSRKRTSNAMNIDDAVQYFLKANTKLKFAGNEKLIQALELIESTALTSGLLPQHIIDLVDVAANGVQVQVLNKRLIKALIPASVVPEQAVLKCISWLCTRKPALKIQCLLLRWIIVIFDQIDKRDKLHCLYGILFYFLHYQMLTPYVCHLLYLLTRKEDVTLVRVRMLLQYQKDLGPKPFLMGLLSIYRYYYPSLVHMVSSRTLKSFFPTYDRAWSAAVRQVREHNGLNPDVGLSWHEALAERLHPSGQNDLVPSRKRRKVDPIPVIHSLATKTSYRQDQLALTIGMNKVPFIMIQTFKDVINNLDSIEFPSQIGGVLRSHSLQHVMSYTRDPIAAARFQFWLSETLQEELVCKFKDKNKSRVTTLLELLVSYTDFLQEGIPAIDLVLSEYLQHWNGVDYCYLILKLISRSQFTSYKALSTAVLEPLQKLFSTSSVYFKCKVLLCLTQLLRNIVTLRMCKDPVVGLFQSEEEEVESLTPSDLVQFIRHVTAMMKLGLMTDKHHPLLELCLLDYIDIVCGLHVDHGFPFVFLIHPRLLERLFVSPNPITLSRLCHVMVRYKENFTSLRSLQKAHQIEQSSGEFASMIPACNCLIRDFCNSLWKFNAYTTEDQESVFYINIEEIDKHLIDTDVEESLSLFRHAAMLPFAVHFLEQHQCDTNFNLDDLKTMKKEFLQYLQYHHLDGISEFMSTFIKSRSLSTNTTAISAVGMTQINDTRAGTSMTSAGDKSAFGF